MGVRSSSPPGKFTDQHREQLWRWIFQRHVTVTEFHLAGTGTDSGLVEVDKDGAMAATGSFCSSGVISTGNNSTPVSEEVVTGRRRETRPSFCQSLSHLK